MGDRPPPIPLEYETPPPQPPEPDFEAAFRRANEGTGGEAALGVVVATFALLIGISNEPTWQTTLISGGGMLGGGMLFLHGLRHIRRQP